MSSTIQPENVTALFFNNQPPCVTAATSTSTEDWISSPGVIPIGSLETWKTLQHQDPDTSHVIHLITTGDSPRKSSAGTAVNRFFKHAVLKDGLLVVKAYDPKLL